MAVESAPRDAPRDAPLSLTTSTGAGVGGIVVLPEKTVGDDESSQAVQ